MIVLVLAREGAYTRDGVTPRALGVGFSAGFQNLNIRMESGAISEKVRFEILTFPSTSLAAGSLSDRERLFRVPPSIPTRAH